MNTKKPSAASTSHPDTSASAEQVGTAAENHVDTRTASSTVAVTGASPPEEQAFDAKAFLASLTTRPGVYRMLDNTGDIIYVGKASNLKNRVSSYFQKNVDSPKTRALVSRICGVQTTVTDSARDALILEHNLIKEHRPRYNVLLRDDKSYPYIYIANRQDYPRLSYQRGARKLPGKYIGPYPNASAVKKSLRLVQRLFQVRQCEDSYFRNRSRPCLQYQIKRCTAPCVEYISKEDYREDVTRTIKILEGKSDDVIKDLEGRMEKASQALEFETAAKLRDQIVNLKVVNDMSTTMREHGNADYVAALTKGGQSCVQVFFVRNGINLGNKAFYPATPPESTNSDILNAFIPQFYLEHDVPREIITSEPLDDVSLLQEVLSARNTGAVSITHAVRGSRAKLQALAVTNAEIALDVRLTSRSGMAARLDSLRQIVGMEDLPQRMECFDISHTMGEATVASCVVFNAEGPLKSDYRRFSIEDITGGDDYAAMRQALMRRYTRMLKENRQSPDILFIDGGKGQVSIAEDVLKELQIDDICLVGVSKGPDRRPGEETLLLVNQQIEIQLSNDSPGLLLIQQIRDEAHRFAVAGHRGKRNKARKQSILEDIPGLGPKRRKALLTRFGGLHALQQAGIADIASVPGISEQLAESVYDILHPAPTPR